MRRDNLRPKTWDEFIGQDHIRPVLQTAIEASLRSDRPMDHVLLDGPPGTGKTTLAFILSEELAIPIRAVISQTINQTHTLYDVLLRLEEPHIFFIDEIHRLRRPIRELLYPVLEDNIVYGQYNREKAFLLPPLTVVGATTMPERLEEPFIDRFPIHLRLKKYSERELLDICLGSEKRLNIMLPIEVRDLVVRRADGTPRILNNYLRRIRDFVTVHEKYSTFDLLKFVAQVDEGISR